MNVARVQRERARGLQESAGDADAHFWAGSSLAIVGDDGVVRKLSFKEPDRQGVHNAM